MMNIDLISQDDEFSEKGQIQAYNNALSVGDRFSVGNIDRSKLKADKYFKSLMDAAVDAGIFYDFDIENVQTQLLEILSDLCAEIQQQGNSSLKIETVEEISESLMYIISVTLKKCKIPEEAVLLIKENKLKDLFLQGNNLLNGMLTKARGDWQLICKNPFKTLNEYYNFTVQTDIPRFFKQYDKKNAAHKNSVHFSYPIYLDNSALIAAEYAENYINSLYIETKFLTCFNEDDIHSLLCGLDRYFLANTANFSAGIYKEMPINIFEYVFACCIGSIILGKNFELLSLCRDDVKKLSDVLLSKNRIKVTQILKDAAKSLAESINADDEVSNYLIMSAERLADEISAMRDASSIASVFIERNNDVSTTIAFENIAKMSDSEFRFVVKQLESRSDSETRKSIIKEYIICAEDFIDLLSGTKLSREEIVFSVNSLGLSQFFMLATRYPLGIQYDNKEDIAVTVAIKKRVLAMSKNNRKLFFKLMNMTSPL